MLGNLECQIEGQDCCSESIPSVPSQEIQGKEPYTFILHIYDVSKLLCLCGYTP